LRFESAHGGAAARCHAVCPCGLPVWSACVLPVWSRKSFTSGTSCVFSSTGRDARAPRGTARASPGKRVASCCTAAADKHTHTNKKSQHTHTTCAGSCKSFTSGTSCVFCSTGRDARAPRGTARASSGRRGASCCTHGQKSQHTHTHNLFLVSQELYLGHLVRLLLRRWKLGHDEEEPLVRRLAKGGPRAAQTHTDKKSQHTHTHTHNLFLVRQEVYLGHLLRLLLRLCRSWGTSWNRLSVACQKGSCRWSLWCHQTHECAEQGGCRGTARPPATSVLLGGAPRVRDARTSPRHTSPRHTSPRHSVALSSVCCCQSHLCVAWKKGGLLLHAHTGFQTQCD
jgi:hypothetical protein